MTELSLDEMKHVNGGVAPLIVVGAIQIGKALAGGFALGVAAGSLMALLDF
ncbi:class IIb bacteriocin, lactobin A/cerein 7B family [Paraferrimonas sedimenticola]|uniref:Class IIb bacteriocin, lactobin A/cerein 7B family n=1 Tax=Paraferrimonas sedimenticola TaxID=375674 RepID=A0AA37W0B9_9GAMM|nr:class IIb bacteriocin, lactobin A/cerein 7B family [Paraferrimonas sedimenticola]GLP97764.1 hypothetical protein GCM10007895_30710 [Paraferrimonas sedimenticola]